MSGDSPSDSDLIERSLAQPPAFDEVFRRHFPDIFRFAARQLGAADGEDVAAETFARAFAGRARFHAEGSARPWLFGICVNVMLQRHRSERRGALAQRRAYEPDRVAADEDAVASAIDAERERVALWAALSELRVDQQRVLILFALGGLAPSEIATALAIPQGTVRSHLFRARRAMRTVLSADPGLAAGAPDSAAASAWRL